MGAVAGPQPELTSKSAPHRWAPALAWAAILIASDLDFVVAHPAGVSVSGSMRLVSAVLLAVLAMGIRPQGSSRHLRGFVLALAAMVAGDWLMVQVQARIEWFSTAPAAQAMFARVFLTFIPAGLMALTLVGSGISRRDLYLTRGDLRAPAVLPMVRGAKWNAIALPLLIVISGGLLAQLWFSSHASRHFHPGVLLLGLPAACIFAALNAGCEEFRFRCLLLARGTRCVGATHALLATSFLFGVAHFFGHPGGFSGVLMAAFFAWIVGRSMLDCRGWGWAWLLHFVEDVLIFLMVLMTGV